MNLEYITINERNYTDLSIGRLQAMQHIAESAIAIKYYSRCVISTVVGWWLPRIPRQHVAILNCHGEDNLLAASHYLRMSRVGYCPIKDAYPITNQIHKNNVSTFLVVTDVVGSFKRVANFISRVPGNSYNPYDNHFRGNRSLLLRTISSRLFISTLPFESPQFPDNSTLTNQKSIAWLQAFRDHWNSDEVKRAMLAMKLTKALNDKTIATMASDPKFII